MDNTTWELPFGQPAELEMQTEWGNLSLVPVEPGQSPRLELSSGSAENIAVHVDKQGDAVRVSLEPQRSFKWFGGWECRATLYVPRDVRAHLQTNAGSVSVRDLEDCELGVKVNAGKIDLVKVYGLVHLSADAGSVTGREVGGFFDIETQAGSVRLEITDLQPGEHRIRATAGSVRLELARGLDVSIETHTSMGSVRNRYPSRPSANTKLVLSTEMGSVRVDEGGSYRSGRRPGPPTRTEGTWQSAPPAPGRREPDTGSEGTGPAVPAAEDLELERILKMVEAGSLSAQDADELLRAMGRV